MGWGAVADKPQVNIDALEKGHGNQQANKAGCAHSLVTHIALTVLAVVAAVALVLGVLAFTGHLSQVTSFINKQALWFTVGAGLVFIATFATGVALLSCKNKEN
jgi:ABC-type multidrug transport system permease subunit